MNLIIVESPTKSKTLSKFLGEGYKILASMGHIRDLPERKFGVDTSHDFTPDYVLIKGKEETVKNIQETAKKAEKIYLATDPDREGEAIAWHVSQLLRVPREEKVPRVPRAENSRGTRDTLDSRDTSLFRITFHEITKHAIGEALAHPGQINMALVNAQQARRILDRIVGYKLSPLLWYKVRKGLSAGRVQTVAVRLIVEREREIEKFVPKEYWQIFAQLRKYLGGKLPNAPIFTALLVKKNGNKIEIQNRIQADEVVAELEKAGFEIGGVEKKDAKRFPPAPFTTSTLQQTAANRLGWSSKKTMQVAQDLYEQGLITYHRTDSTNLAWEAVNKCREFINQQYSEKYLPEAARIYKTKSKVAQEAHEAIRPTDIKLKINPPAGGEKLKMREDEERLYDLIWKRFVACQMKEAIVEETRVDINAIGQINIYTLEARGEVEKFNGWKILYDKGNGETAKTGIRIDSLDNSHRFAINEQPEQLPPLTKGDALELQKLNPIQKFTQPPPRFNEASLIKTLEELGIGRPSTYAPTISTILERMYVEKKEKNFVPTNLGFAVNDFLLEYFPDVFDYQFTAHMEDDLDEIANGKQEWVPVVREFYEPFNLKLIGVSRVAERVAVETETTGEKCPKCGQGQVVIRVGRFGKFLSCSRFPACDYRAPYIAKTGLKCPKCGGEVVYKKTKKGKGFYGCSNYPKCNFASWRKPK